MKNLFNIILFFALFTCHAYSQDVARYIPDAQLAGVDTLKGADTIYIRTPFLKWNLDYIGLQATCRQLGGTSDGYIYPQASIDDIGYVDLISTDYLVYSFPNDTLTIADGTVGLWNILALTNNYAGIMCVGTVGDTTEITLKFSIKGRK
jgi:hypothetical protein